MKKITLMTSSILALGIVGISTSATNISAASTSHQTSISNSVDMRDNFEDIILDKGEFSSPLTLEKYDYDLNHMPGNFNFETGKVVIDYSAKVLTDLDGEVDKYFNLELPSEFYIISEINNGEAMKTAITAASYHLPGESDPIKFTPAEIDTSHFGKINFTLPKTAVISADEVINIKIQIYFGQILDDLNYGPDYDYTQLIPNAASGPYHFKGALTSKNSLEPFPEGVAIGYTDEKQAIQ
ncbi:hypothetical protein AB996_1783 [Lactococcus cremoris]|uniref:Uncharacterized protein n=1 Tax=Lactococcus lactis subsp. cremoris TaxID=1359 RepID=A0A166J404_LACLC|nr:hypothetical protein [Lactococcus cremoris]KZK05495.1 hypothetical protein AB996_1783 [Lactococcus cremoris]